MIHPKSSTLTELLKRPPFWAILPSAFRGLLLLNDSDRQNPAEENRRRYAALAKSTAASGRSDSASRQTLLIPVMGVLTSDCDWCGTTYGTIQSGLEKAASDPNIEQVILYVDSPGGEAMSCMETADQIYALAKDKPVTAMVSGMAASAAYWLASQARQIVLAPSGEVGSVGVRVMHADFSGMLEEAGIKITELAAGDYKTEFSPFAPLTDEAKANAQQKLGTIYSQFLDAVTRGRGMRAAASADGKYGNGRMLQASEAMSAGLVDKLQAPRDFFRGLTPADGQNTKPGLPYSSLTMAQLALKRLKMTGDF